MSGQVISCTADCRSSDYHDWTSASRDAAPGSRVRSRFFQRRLFPYSKTSPTDGGGIAATQTLQSLQFAIIQCMDCPSPIQSNPIPIPGPSNTQTRGPARSNPAVRKPCRILPCWLPPLLVKTPHHHTTSLRPGTSRPRKIDSGSCVSFSSVPGALIPAQCYSLARVEVSPLASLKSQGNSAPFRVLLTGRIVSSSQTRLGSRHLSPFASSSFFFFFGPVHPQHL